MCEQTPAEKFSFLATQSARYQGEVERWPESNRLKVITDVYLRWIEDRLIWQRVGGKVNIFDSRGSLE